MQTNVNKFNFSIATEASVDFWWDTVRDYEGDFADEPDYDDDDGFISMEETPYFLMLVGEGYEPEDVPFVSYIRRLDEARDRFERLSKTLTPHTRVVLMGHGAVLDSVHFDGSEASQKDWLFRRIAERHTYHYDYSHDYHTRMWLAGY